MMAVLKKLWIYLDTLGPTISQNCWYNIPVNPSSLGALLPLTPKAALLISSLVIEPVNLRFIAYVTHGTKPSNRDSKSWELELEKRSRKYSTAIWPLESYENCSRSISSFNIRIMFLSFLPLTLLWKNFVFLSPALSHYSLLRCRQKSSSSRKASASSYISWCIKLWSGKYFDISFSRLFFRFCILFLELRFTE